MVARSGFASAASAKQFLAKVDLGPSFTIPAIGLMRHPMSGLFAMSLDSTVHSSAATLLAQTGATPGAASAGGTSSQTVSAAAASTPPDPTTIGGAAGIRDQVQQSFAVGNGIISFDQGVTADRKTAAVNSTLLAQLVADNLYPDRTVQNYSTNWYGAYFNTLVNIGWIIQGNNNVRQFTGKKEGTVDQEVVTLASALIGASGAVAVKAVLDSLKGMSSDNPVITIFQQTSQTNSVAQFSVALASQDASAAFSLNGLEFDLTATGSDTQVLFFHWQSENVTLNWRNLQLSIDDAVFSTVAADIAGKIASYVQSFVKEINIPQKPASP